MSSLFPSLVPLSLEANADRLVIESASTGIATAAKSARRQWTNTNLTLLFLQIAVGVMTAPERRRSRTR